MTKQQNSSSEPTEQEEFQKLNFCPWPACKWVRLAIERHYNDLERVGSDDFRYRFNQKKANRVLKFFRYLRHSKGEWAGEIFELELWQIFILSVAFGWEDENGHRRFKVVYIEIPRKNGKSTLTSGGGLYLLMGDREMGAEIVSAATKKDQAKIVFNESARMLKKSPELKKFAEALKTSIFMDATGGNYVPLGADADTMDGLNLHGAVVDELHAHKSRKIWDVLETATGSRRQPMIIAITTAGHDINSVCFEVHEYTQKVLEGIFDDDEHFGIIYTIDEGDDWTEEFAHRKANPNYGISVKPNDINRLCKKAVQSPPSQNAFKRLRLNVWTEQATRWLNMEKWKRCPKEIDWERVKELPCYLGMDLSESLDITAVVGLFPEPDWSDVYLKSWFWIPEDKLTERVQERKLPYDVWRDEGWLIETPGNVIDFNFIEHTIIEEIDKEYNLVEVGFDPWNALGLVQNLEKAGLKCVKMRQGYHTMSHPSKTFEAIMEASKLRHGFNPVLTWMASNAAIRMDPNKNIMPDKQKSGEKIDGIVAGIMALGVAISTEGEPESAYEDRGLTVF